MSCLHTVNKAPRLRLLESCLSVINKEDAIIFIEDGVYHCADAELLRRLSGLNSCYGLIEDLSARGLSTSVDNVELVSYRTFVELCTSYDKIVSWF